MPFELNWSHSFCLACDKQTDGNVFCSESCRLAEFDDDCSGTSSIASSPNISRISIPSSRDSAKSINSPSSIQLNVDPVKAPSCYIHSTLPLPSSHFSKSDSQSLSTSKKLETISNAQNLYSGSCQHQTNQLNTNPEISQLSEESRRALRGYSNCFNQSRYSSRRQPGY